MIRIAQVGTFDIDNLGDLLFPIVFRRLIEELAGELGTPIECTLFSPQGLAEGQLYCDQQGSLPLDQLDQMDGNSPFDLIFIGGGDIVRNDDVSLASIYGLGSPPMAYSQLSSPTKSGRTRLVLLMPGVPFPLSPGFRVYLANSFWRLRYAAVRDRLSAARLAEVVPTAIRLRVLPDLVSAIAHFYPRVDLKARMDSLGVPDRVRTGYICFQAHPALCADVDTTGRKLRYLEQQSGLPVVVLEIGKALGDSPFLEKLATRFGFAFAPEVGTTGKGAVLQKVAVIAGSRGYIGTSLHGAILAHAYGVPHFCFSGAAFSKMRGFYETCATGTCFSNFAECFDQIDLISKQIGLGAEPLAAGSLTIPKTDDYALIRHFVHSALASIAGSKEPRSPNFIHQINLRHRRFQSEHLWRLEVLIANVRFPWLSTRFPRLHLLAIRTIKLAWWTITFQLPSKYRQRRNHLQLDPNDRSLGIPFPWVPLKAEPVPTIAVICHLFFDDLADEFRSELSNLPFPFDLWITTDTKEKKLKIEQVFAGWSRGRVEVRLSQNRGRDIAPKLITCADVYGKYEYILHIHGKQSPYGGPFLGWRKHLLGTLIGSPEIVSSIFEIFRNLPNIGMIAPENPKWLRPIIGWGSNQNEAEVFCRRFALNLNFQRHIDFPAGSMFWARSAALQPLLNAALSFDDFPPETGQVDGTLAHVIERLYFQICDSAGYDWIRIARLDMDDVSQEAIQVTTPEGLRNLTLGRWRS
jgi:polysaccharide pyruvyl transferase WcaK-like protein